MKRARRVAAISCDVAHDLAERWPSLADKISAIPLAASTQLDRAAWDAAEAQRPAEPVLFYPATVSPHKGHATLLTAARALRDQARKFRVCLSGHGTEALSEPPMITGYGYASRSCVEMLYRQSCAVVLPSLFEGFGLPLAEALAHGTPVICSDLPILP